MPEAKTIDPTLVVQIVRSYVAHSKIASTDLPNLIATVHRSLAQLGTPVDTPAPEPAVAISRSYARNFVVCLDCGWRGQMLRRHLTTSHGLTPSDYRARWGLKVAHPIVAPAYTERRSTLARQFGLGRKRQAPAILPEPAPRRRGRSRTPGQSLT